MLIIWIDWWASLCCSYDFIFEKDCTTPSYLTHIQFCSLRWCARFYWQKILLFRFNKRSRLHIWLMEFTKTNRPYFLRDVTFLRKKLDFDFSATFWHCRQLSDISFTWNSSTRHVTCFTLHCHWAIDVHPLIRHMISVVNCLSINRLIQWKTDRRITVHFF